METERPHARLIRIFREASLDGEEPDYEDSAQLLREIAGNPVEINALLRAMEESNDSTLGAETLHRHARKARNDIGREIVRLDHREASVLVWGQSAGIGATLLGCGGLLAGTIAIFGGVPIVLAGASLFGVATWERQRSGAEKERLASGRDDLDLLNTELERAIVKK